MYSGKKWVLSLLMAGLLSVNLQPAIALADDANAPKERQFFAMTTVMNLKAYGEDSEAALDEAEQAIKDLDSLLSTGTKGSEVWEINNSGGGTLSADTAALTEASLKLYEETDGAFDFTIYPIMDLWGFTKLYDEDSTAGSGDDSEEASTEERLNLLSHVPTRDEIDALLPLVDSSKVKYDESLKTITLPEHAKIDFGGIAKGYASQKVMEIFQKHGLTGGLADLGGNIQVTGSKPDGNPWRVAIEDPSDTSGQLGILSLSKDSTVITSGGYERYLVDKDGNKYSHIIDPSSGYPVENDLTSVSIVCDNGTLADGLSTSLCVMGKEKAISFWKEHKNEFDMVLFDTDQKITISAGLEDSFLSDSYDVAVVK